MKCNEKKSKSDKMHFMVYYNAFSFHFDVKFICKLVSGPRRKRRQECLISSFKQSQLLFRCNVHSAYFLTNFIFLASILGCFFLLSIFLNWRPTEWCVYNKCRHNKSQYATKNTCMHIRWQRKFNKIHCISAHSVGVCVRNRVLNFEIVERWNKTRYSTPIITQL